jgi:hypothetical protein
MRTVLFMNTAAKKPMKTKSRFQTLPSAHKTLALSIAMGLGMMLPSFASAASPNVSPPNLRADAPNVYIVKKGDTLWDISKHFLKTPWRWPEIWASNKHVRNPHWIYPGDRLLLCLINGRSVVGRDEGDGCDGIARRMNDDSALPTVRLQPQVRIEALNAAVPLSPLSSIEHWLKRTRIVAAEDVAATPYVVGTKSNQVITAAGQTVYVRGNGLEVGQAYAVYREGKPYLAEDKQKTNLGVELSQMATGIVTAVNGDIATLELQKSFEGEVRNKDRVMPEIDQRLPDMFQPSLPDEVKAGTRIIRVLDSVSSTGKGGVIALNRGVQDGAKAGQIFAIYQQGHVIKDPKLGDKVQLPNERVGVAMVFSAYDHVSYAYVLESDVPVRANDELRSPLGDLEDQL